MIGHSWKKKLNIKVDMISNLMIDLPSLLPKIFHFIEIQQQCLKTILSVFKNPVKPSVQLGTAIVKPYS